LQRLLRTGKLLSSLASWLALRPSVTSFVSLLVQIFFVAHWFGCLYAFVAMEDSNDTHKWWLPSLRRDVDMISDEYSLGSKYLCVYHAGSSRKPKLHSIHPPLPSTSSSMYFSLTSAFARDRSGATHHTLTRSPSPQPSFSRYNDWLWRYNSFRTKRAHVRSLS
jgi:hypothetical protein